MLLIDANVKLVPFLALWLLAATGAFAHLNHKCPQFEGASISTRAQHGASKTAVRSGASKATLVEQSDGYDLSNNFDVAKDPKPAPPPLEMVPLIISGPSSNRVDLVFFSDGLRGTSDTIEERAQFVEDAMRLAQDVSRNQTFNTVQPLLNFWAAYTPSKESGVGVGGVPKDTPFGLYRDGTELRGVYYAHPEVGRAACDSLKDQCDYPILLGNDPLYGGLGGDFTVITASVLNGPLVLRHELGHSILEVGEEYDGGWGYFGHNAAHSPKDISWTQWLSDPSRKNQDGTPRIERSSMAMQVYPWTLLNTTDPWAIEFLAAGTYSRYSLQFSLSGLPVKENLKVTLDGVDLGWEPRLDVGLDRWFYNFYSETPLSSGKHVLSFSLRESGREGTAQLCSTEILEYGNEEEFISTPSFYSLYPTYSDSNETSYRPTNADCLMRLVTSPNFCKVCMETLWIHLLRRIELVDSTQETCVSGPDGTLNKSLALQLLPLGHLRGRAAIPQESYTVLWEKDGESLPQFVNKTKVELMGDEYLGQYTALVKFSSPEIRRRSSATKSRVEFNLFIWPKSTASLNIDAWPPPLTILAAHLFLGPLEHQTKATVNGGKEEVLFSGYIMSYSAADVKYDIDNLRHNLELSESEETWDKIAGAFKTFTGLCEAGAFDANPTEVVNTVRSSHRQITSAMNSERTRLSLTAMDFISALATAMGRSFDQVMPLFLPPLLGLCARTNKVIIKSARGSIFTIIETTQLANVLTYFQQFMKDKSSSLKLVIAEGTLACLNSCNPPDLEKDARALEVEDIIRAMARDANADVRKVSRKIFDSYKILMPSRLSNFTAPMTPTTKKYLDIKASAVSTQPSTSNLRAAATVKPEAKPSTSSTYGHSRTTSTLTTASTMASNNTHNAPTMMTRVARKDPTSHSTTLAPSRPVQAMRIASSTQSTAATVQRRVIAPVRPVRSATTTDVQRPGSALSTHTSGPTRGTAVATSSVNVGAPHRLQVKPSSHLGSTNTQSGTSSGPRRVPVMAPPPVPLAAAAKDKEGPKRPVSRLDNATSTSTQRFVPTKKPAVPTAASSRDVKPAAASCDAAKGKAPAIPVPTSNKPAVSSSSSLKARPATTLVGTAASSDASNASKAVPGLKPKPTWGRSAQPTKPVPVPVRTATAPAAPRKAPVPHAAQSLSRPAVATKAAPSKSKASSRAPTPSTQDIKKAPKVEAPEAEAAVENHEEHSQETEEEALPEELVETPEPVLRSLSPTPSNEMEEKVKEINEAEAAIPEAELEEVNHAAEGYEEDTDKEEEEEGNNNEHVIVEVVEDSLPSDERPHTPQVLACPPSTNPAFGLATKTPISALLSSIERGFLYSPVTPLSPADLYLPNGATPYSHQTHAPHLQGQGGPRQPFNHALYAQGENGGIFGGFGGMAMAPMKREEDMVRGDLGVVPLHEHNKLFKGAGMSTLDDGNRQAFLELNQ